MEAKDIMSFRSQQSQSKDDVLDMKMRVRGSLYTKPYLQSIQAGRLCLKADLHSVYVWNYLCDSYHEMYGPAPGVDQARRCDR